MKKRKIGRKFAREKDARRALKKSLAASLILKGRIETTLAKAKDLRPFVERLTNHAKAQNITSLRYLLRYLPRKAAEKLNNKIAALFKDRNGGYTRIIKTRNRRSDAAPLAIIEFVSWEKEEKTSSSKSLKQKNEKAK